MSKADLIKLISEKLNCSRTEVDNFLIVLGEAIYNAYMTEGTVPIGDIGTFKVKHIKARIAINPRTKETVQVPAKKKLVFVPAKEYTGS